MLIPRIVVWMFSAGILALGAGMVCGQNYPNKPIRIVAPAPGSGSDVMSRFIAQGISGALGQPVIVDNRSISLLASDIVAKATPDGYTLHVTGASLWTVPFMQTTTYDPVRDFSPITMVESSVNVVVVHPSLPVKSVKELIALAKASPGKLNYGTGGVGTSTHLATELFKFMAGVDVVCIQYKGTGAAIVALLGGQEVQMMVGSAAVVVPHHKSGKLRTLAVSSSKPSALFPELPTVAATVPGYVSLGVTGVWAPANTPAAIVNRLNQEIVRFLRTAEAKEKLSNLGSDVVGSAPGEFAAFIKSDMAIMGKVIKDAGIRME